jgi:beta-lactamase class A
MHEAFAMASTFKWLLAAAVLKLCEDGLELGPPVYYTRSDLIAYSPVTEPAIDPATGMGALTIEQLCAAAVSLSDNTAANLLLIPTFGPEGLTQFIRSAGDAVTRLDRREPDLNENRVDDLRDTTTPQAMAQLARRLLVSDRTLNAASRERLISWLIASSTGLDRLRAGFPNGWRAGDKTGTGGNGSHNDVAIVWPPGRGPILIASYLSESAASSDLKAAAHAEIGRAVIEAFN